MVEGVGGTWVWGTGVGGTGVTASDGTPVPVVGVDVPAGGIAGPVAGGRGCTADRSSPRPSRRPAALGPQSHTRRHSNNQRSRPAASCGSS